MIETEGLGAGSYPDEPEKQEKLYRFEFVGLAEGYGYVYAEDELSASIKASQRDYDSIEDLQLLDINEVTRIEED